MYEVKLLANVATVYISSKARRAFKGLGEEKGGGGHSSPCSADNYSYTLLLEAYFPENIAKEENNIIYGNSLGGKATSNILFLLQLVMRTCNFSDNTVVCVGPWSNIIIFYFNMFEKHKLPE